MEDSTIQTNENYHEGRNIHFILSHSYIVFLFSVVIGVVFDVLIPLKFLSTMSFEYTGLVMVLLGSAIVYWAQRASSGMKKKKIEMGINFEKGPYKYSRHPTHLGIFIMTLGLAFMISSPFSIIFTIIAYVITRIFFIKKEEKFLSSKYGDIYGAYKNKTKNLL